MNPLDAMIPAIVRREKPAYVDWGFVRQVVKARNREIAAALREVCADSANEEILRIRVAQFCRALEAGE